MIVPLGESNIIGWVTYDELHGAIRQPAQYIQTIRRKNRVHSFNGTGAINVRAMAPSRLAQGIHSPMAGIPM